MTLPPIVKKGTIAASLILAGIIIGGFLFTDTRPRFFWSLPDCGHSCWSKNEITGIIAAVGIQTAPNFVPGVVKETDKVIVVRHPFPRAPYHYLIFPKKDIKDIADVSADDREYVTEAWLVIGELIREQHLTGYQVVTNAPDTQLVRYLHFHLLAKK